MLDPKEASEIESLKEAIRALDAKVSGLRGLAPPSFGSVASAGATDRFAKYGLKRGDADARNLVVSAHETVRLNHASTSRYARNYHSLKPKSIKQLKQWVGVPDRVAEKSRDLSISPRRSYLKSNPLVSTESLQEAEALANIPDRRANLQALAKDYLLRDSAVYVAWEPQLNLVISAVTIYVAMFFDVVIESGATLHVDRDTDVLLCNRLIVHSGGTLIASGNLKIDANSAEGNVG